MSALTIQLPMLSLNSFYPPQPLHLAFKLHLTGGPLCFLSQSPSQQPDPLTFSPTSQIDCSWFPSWFIHCILFWNLCWVLFSFISYSKANVPGSHSSSAIFFFKILKSRFPPSDVLSSLEVLIYLPICLAMCSLLLLIGINGGDFLS